MAIYNFTGFLFYSVYTIATFAHHHGLENKNNPIAINDIAFAVHALLLTTICCFQIIIYDRGHQKPSLFALILGFVCWLIAIYNVLLSLFGGTLHFMPVTVPWFGSFSSVSFFGFIKVTVTTIKYIPQCYMNYRDKSTTGWSIHNVLLDFLGGSLSLLQQVLSGYNTDDWTFVTCNIPKFILGAESIVFDLIFMCQHYVLYGDNHSPNRQSDKHKKQKANINNHGDANDNRVSVHIKQNEYESLPE